MRTETSPTDLISPDVLAAELGIPERTLAQWRYLNRGPRYARVGRHVRYRRSDVDSWLEGQMVDAGSCR